VADKEGVVTRSGKISIVCVGGRTRRGVHKDVGGKKNSFKKGKVGRLNSVLTGCG